MALDKDKKRKGYAEGGEVSGPPEHVEHQADGGYTCRHCAGRVGEDGFTLVEVENEATEEGRAPPSEDDFWNAVGGEGGP